MQALFPMDNSMKQSTPSALTWKDPVDVSSPRRAANGVSGSPVRGPAGDLPGMTSRTGGYSSGPQLGSVNVQHSFPESFKPQNGHADYSGGFVDHSSRNGIPENVMVMPLVESKMSSASPPAARKTIRSRARARRPDEPSPFLSVDTVPADKVVLEGKTTPPKHLSNKKHSKSVTKRISPDFLPPSTARRSQTPNYPPFSPYGGGKSTPRVPSRAGSSMHNYNSFFTHKNSAFLAGPPSLWSLNNRFWPHQATPTEGRRRLAPIQPSMAMQADASALKPNYSVSQPFKHDVDNCTPVERPVSPSQDLKESTLLGLQEVTRALNRGQEPPPSRKGGRLLKGKLKPLHTFQLDGPRIEECNGILTEDKRGQTADNARLLQRKRELLSMLPADVLQGGVPSSHGSGSGSHLPPRPETHESIHRTSIVSALSLDRDYTVLPPATQHIMNGQLKSQSMVEGPTSLGPYNSMITIIDDTSASQVDVPAVSEDQPDGPSTDRTAQSNVTADGPSPNTLEPEKMVVRGDMERISDAVSESSMSDYLSEGGRAEILCNMVSRVKESSRCSQASAKSDHQPAPLEDDQSDATELEAAFDDVFPMDASHHSKQESAVEVETGRESRANGGGEETAAQDVVTENTIPNPQAPDSETKGNTDETPHRSTPLEGNNYIETSQQPEQIHPSIIIQQDSIPQTTGETVGKPQEQSGDHMQDLGGESKEDQREEQAEQSQGSINNSSDVPGDMPDKQAIPEINIERSDVVIQNRDTNSDNVNENEPSARTISDDHKTEPVDSPGVQSPDGASAVVQQHDDSNSNITLEETSSVHVTVDNCATEENASKIKLVPETKASAEQVGTPTILVGDSKETVLQSTATESPAVVVQINEPSEEGTVLGEGGEEGGSYVKTSDTAQGVVTHVAASPGESVDKEVINEAKAADGIGSDGCQTSTTLASAQETAQVEIVIDESENVSRHSPKSSGHLIEEKDNEAGRSVISDGSEKEEVTGTPQIVVEQDEGISDKNGNSETPASRDCDEGKESISSAMKSESWDGEEKSKEEEETEEMLEQEESDTNGGGKKDDDDDGNGGDGGSGGAEGGGGGGAGDGGSSGGGGDGGGMGGDDSTGGGGEERRDGNMDSHDQGSKGGDEEPNDSDDSEELNDDDSQGINFKSLEQLLEEVQAASTRRKEAFESYDDIPEVDDAFLFCEVCGLDEDTCVCPDSSLRRLLGPASLELKPELEEEEEEELLAGSSQQENIVLEYKMLFEEPDPPSSCYSEDLVTPRTDIVSAWHPSSGFGSRGAQSGPPHSPGIMLAAGKSITPMPRPFSAKTRPGSSKPPRPGSHRPGLKEEPKGALDSLDVVSDSGCGSEMSEAVTQASELFTDEEDLYGSSSDLGSKSELQLESSGQVAESESKSADLEIVARPKLRHAKGKPDTPPLAPFPPLCFRLTARPPPGRLYYFAYGPTMNPARLETYVGSPVEQRLWGILFGFALKFNKKGEDVEAGGFANIEFSPDSSVEGCVYSLTPSQLASLDQYMGCPQFYTKIVLPVWMVNCSDPHQPGVAQYCIPAVIYIALDKWTHTDTSSPLSSKYSIRQCLKGADMLSPAYRQHLEACAC